jgi:hypothetical protein
MACHHMTSVTAWAGDAIESGMAMAATVKTLKADLSMVVLLLPCPRGQETEPTVERSPNRQLAHRDPFDPAGSRRAGKIARLPR